MSKTIFIRDYPAESSPVAFTVEQYDALAGKPNAPVVCCYYDPDREVFSVPPRIEMRAGEWIDNPALDALRQWRKLREEALTELAMREDSPHEN